MNKKYIYLLKFYFLDKSNIQIENYSNQKISEFTDNFNIIFQNKDFDFYNFVGTDKKVMINKNNILFYTIELVEENKSIEDILKITQKSKGDVKNENNNV